MRSTVGFSVTLWLVLAAAVLPSAAQNSQGLALNAEAVLLLDADGKVLFAKNSGDDHAPASLVKLMTLYLAFEDLEAGRAEWDEGVTVSRHAAYTPRYRMGLRAGERIRVRPLGAAAGPPLIRQSDWLLARFTSPPGSPCSS